MKTTKELLAEAQAVSARRTTQPGPCETHGAFESSWHGSRIPSLGFWSRCPQCDAEIAREQEAWAEQHRTEDAEVLRRRRLVEAGIPERFRELDIADYQDYLPGQQKAKRWAASYVRGFSDPRHVGRNFLLLGKPGTGKTMLCCCIAMALQRTGRSVLYSTMQRAIRRVRSTYDNDATETEAQAIESMIAPDLLVLDEVGVQSGSDFERNLSFDLVNERYGRQKPTLLISNMPRDDIARFLGDRIMDRLTEGGGKVLAFTWESYRSPTRGGAQ